MRSVRSLLAAGAASLLSTAAFAADLPIAAPHYQQPVAEFGGWYLRGDIGFSNQKVKNVRNLDETLYAPLTSYQQNTAFDTAGVFGLGVGYQFNNWFRGDVTGQYRGRSNFKGVDQFTFPWGGGSASGVDNYNASKSELLFLANAYVDLGTWWCVTPFIGAGVGAARVTISNFTDSGLNNANFDQLGNPVVSGPPVGSFVSMANGSKWNFAWAAHAGLAYKVNPNLTLEVAYSYVDMGEGITGVGQTFDGTAVKAFKFKDITSHDLMFGMRWNLNTPAPAYPLVTKG